MSARLLSSSGLSHRGITPPGAAPVVGGVTGSPQISQVTIAGVLGTLYRWTANGSVDFSASGRARCVVIGGAANASSFGTHGGLVFDGWIDIPAGTTNVVVGANGRPGGASSFGSLASAPGAPDPAYNMGAENYSGAGRGLPGAGISDGVASDITGASVTYGKSGAAFAGTDFGCSVAGLNGNPGAVFLWIPS